MRWSRASGVWPTRSRTVGYSRAMRRKRIRRPSWPRRRARSPARG
jgi:hypothetical protein